MTKRKSTRRSPALIAAMCLVAVSAPGCAGDAKSTATYDAAASEGPVSLEPPVGAWHLAPNTVDGEVTFVVQENGEFSGAGPCNNYFGKWSLGPAQNTIGPVGATRKMCAPEAMDAEQHYFAALGKVAGKRVTDGGLSLVDAQGETLLSFVPGDE